MRLRKYPQLHYANYANANFCYAEIRVTDYAVGTLNLLMMILLLSYPGLCKFKPFKLTYPCISWDIPFQKRYIGISRDKTHVGFPDVINCLIDYLIDYLMIIQVENQIIQTKYILFDDYLNYLMIIC